jgi:hypothetical protein
MILTQKLYPLYFPADHWCCSCQNLKVASAVQIISDRLSNRQRYFCPECATAKGFPPSEHLLKRVAEQQGDRVNFSARPRQQPAIARCRG